MCGITGIVSSSPIAETTIRAITAILDHRGPDASGIFLNDTQTVALGHTRLSILDLRPEANQPFYSGDQRYIIVFNGEIYNFRDVKKILETEYGKKFRTTCDTEVIVEAFAVWGNKMVDTLQGMFAIAIFDQHNRKLHLFRDRLGKKPLYYFQSDNLFVFGSEIKALLGHPEVKRAITINKKSITTFLHLGYIPEPDTIYSNVRKFPAGCSGEIDGKLLLKIENYWSVKEHVTAKVPAREGHVRETFLSLFTDAVGKRLIADVPLGAFLSGGTDSSLVTAVAARQTSTRLRTFNIGFEESKFDESRYAREVARTLNTDHTEYILSEKEAIDLLAKYVTHFDEPFADTSAIPTMLVSRLARQHIKVVLTGDGGDELFHGYGAYTWARRLDNASLMALRDPMKAMLQRSGKSRLQRIAHLFEPVNLGGIRSHIFSQEQYFFTQTEIREKLLLEADSFSAFEYEETFPDGADLSAAEKQAIFDLQYYLKDDLLVKVDRASMYYALECRCPLLDHRVVEFALSLPESFKLRKRRTKWLLKEVLRDYLPKDLVDRPKWGFSIPLARWLKGDLNYLFDEYLSEEIIHQVGLCRPGYIQDLKRDFFSGRDYLYNRLWALIVLHKWWKENS